MRKRLSQGRHGEPVGTSTLVMTVSFGPMRWILPGVINFIHLVISTLSATPAKSQRVRANAYDAFCCRTAAGNQAPACRRAREPRLFAFVSTSFPRGPSGTWPSDHHAIAGAVPLPRLEDIQCLEKFLGFWERSAATSRHCTAPGMSSYCTPLLRSLWWALLRTD